MLHWICLDCGNDCSPTVRECPACADAPVRDDSRSQRAVTQGVLALARSLQPSMDIRLLAPAPQQLLLAAVNGNGHSNGKVPALSLEEEDVKILGDETIESLVRPLVESAGAMPVVEAAADEASLIEACVEAVAVAVEVAVESAEGAKGAASLKTAQAAPVVEPLASVAEEHLPVAVEQFAALAAAIQEPTAVETPQAELAHGAVEDLAPVAVLL